MHEERGLGTGMGGAVHTAWGCALAVCAVHWAWVQCVGDSGFQAQSGFADSRCRLCLGIQEGGGGGVGPQFFLQFPAI